MIFETRVLGVAVLAASLLIGDVAFAQLEEITVTARKRDESILKIPLSVQAFSAAQLQENGVSELEDLAAFTPGLDYQSMGNSQAGRFTSELRFRGMNTDILLPINTTGAFLVDGISIAQGAQSVSFADIERVEIIRGPQPVFFGRGTFGGAANYITKDPGEEFGGSIRAEFSPRYGSHNLSASIENSLIDGVLAGRATVSSVQKGAMFTSTEGAELGEERTDAFSGTLLWTPNERTKIKARATFSTDNDGPAATTYVAYRFHSTCGVGTPVTYQTDMGPITSTLGTPYVCGDVPVIPVSNNTSFYTVGPFDTRSFLLNGLDTGTPALDTFGLAAEFTNVSITGEFELSDTLTLTALYGTNSRELTQIRDTDGTDRQAWIAKTWTTLESETFEARLSYDNGGRLRGLVGVSYFDSESGGDLDGGFQIVSNVFGNTLPFPVGTEESTIETVGVFAAVEYDLTDQFSVAVEGRYQDEEKIDGGGNFVTPAIFGDPLKSTNFDPRIIATYTPTNNTTLYASYSEGTLPGQVTPFFLNLSPADLAAFNAQFPGIPTVLGDEEVTNLEIGWKQQFDAVNAWFTLSAYTMDWEAMKSSAAVPWTNALGAPGLAGIRLEGSSTLSGVEFEAGWSPTDSLDLHVAAGYSQAEYDDFANSSFNRILSVPTGVNFKADGNTLPRSPKVSGALSATWNGPQFGQWESFARGDFIHNGETFTDATNLATIAAYQILNLRFGIRNQDNLRLEIFCKNCADEDGWKTGRRLLDLSYSASEGPNFFANQGSPVQAIDHRELGVRVSFDF